MQLSLHADYALRVLIYLGTYPERVVTTREISRAYGISKNHLVRVVHTLAEHGLYGYTRRPFRRCNTRSRATRFALVTLFAMRNRI